MFGTPQYTLEDSTNMKSILLLGSLVVLQVATVAVGAPGPACFQEVNHLKAIYAETNQIASMNEIEYASGLEDVILRELENYDGCPPPKYTLWDTAVFLNTKNNETHYEMLISGNYRVMGCVVTRCARTGEEVVSFAIPMVILQHNRKLDGPPGTKCPEDRPVNHGGLCAPKRKFGYARKSLGPRMCPFGRSPEWPENPILEDRYKGCIPWDYNYPSVKWTNTGGTFFQTLGFNTRDSGIEKLKNKAKYGRKSAVPFECPPGFGPKDLPGCYKAKNEPWWWG